MKLLVRRKGGQGSGNFSHAGRPGLIGGSAPSNVALVKIVNNYKDLSMIDNPRPRLGVPFIISANDNLIDMEDNPDHYNYIHHVLSVNRNDSEDEAESKKSAASIFGLSRDEVNSNNYFTIQDRFYDAGNIRVLYNKRTDVIFYETDVVDIATMRRIQRLYDDGKLPITSNIIWEGKQPKAKTTTLPPGTSLFSISAELSYTDFMNAKYLSLDGVNVVLKGGKGSGNFGHAGRPGEVGGSAEGLSTRPYLVDEIDDLVNISSYSGQSSYSYFVTPDNQLLDIQSEDMPQDVKGEHADVAAEYPDWFGLREDDYIGSNRYAPLRDALNNGYIRVRQVVWNEDMSVGIETAELDTPTLRRLQALYDDNRLFIGDENVWESWRGTITFTRAEFFDAKRVAYDTDRDVYVLKQLEEKGGKGSGNFGHAGRPGEVGGSAESNRAWSGKQEQGSSGLSKLEVGQIGEKLALRVLKDRYGVPFETLNVGINNSPIDGAGDHKAIEIKTGLATNGYTAQHWRATIGQPGKQEAELLRQMTHAEKHEYNAYKGQQILNRKQSMLNKMAEALGAPVTAETVGVILSGDGARADIFIIPGFHLRLPWKDYAIEKYYIGTYDV